ncbi:putative DNA replication complex GINS PSF3 [Micractinium conductrix]|uniref:DNA replication complex GINS PSF3 n=1 Tax=Micractinium conductrix TaxID=554055 RepID=A0A2P6VMV4_9CHLO|nr:putative DNA replication complex GINS PSF3 [Micractinium conductrix]|eukprot:PSC75387.1 putative DNA replication complex GINS PSF3 [Micractinium conductrix]
MDYYSVDAIAAEETYVPVRLVHGVTGVGTVIDASSDRADLQPGARLDMPLWMVPAMAGRNMLQVDLPIFYGNKMRRKMKAGAGCEDLRVRCPHYYSVATRLHAAMQASLTADEEFPTYILNTFRNRYKELLTKAPQVESSLEATQIQGKLSAEESQLFIAAAEAAAAYQRWKGSGSSRSMARTQSLKRKWNESGAAAGGAENGRTAMAAPVALRAAAAARRSPPARRRLVVAAAADELLGAADVDPDNARAAIAVGLKYSGAGQWAKAQEYFERALELPGTGLKRYRDKPPALSEGELTSALYNIACCRSMQGDVENGLIAIAGCVEQGYRDFQQLRSDPDLAALRADDRFEGLLKRFTRQEAAQGKGFMGLF